MMTLLAARYPGYGWERNQGYATQEHRDAIRRLGLTPFHRRSFLALQRTLAGDQISLDLFDEAVASIEQLDATCASSIASTAAAPSDRARPGVAERRMPPRPLRSPTPRRSCARAPASAGRPAADASDCIAVTAGERGEPAGERRVSRG